MDTVGDLIAQVGMNLPDGNDGEVRYEPGDVVDRSLCDDALVTSWVAQGYFTVSEPPKPRKRTSARSQTRDSDVKSLPNRETSDSEDDD